MKEGLIKSTKCTDLIHKSDLELIKKLPVNLQKYALAKNSQKISDLPKNEAIKVIFGLIEKTLLDLAWPKQAEEEDIHINTAANCFELIKDRYPFLTVNEMKLAFLNGSLENYGKYIGLGLKTISDWLKGYSNDESKKKAMAEWNNLIHLVQIKEKTEDEKIAIELDGCVNFFEEYKNNGLLNQIISKPDKLAAIFYDRLKEIGVINFSKDRKLEIYKRAEKEYKENLERKVNDRTSGLKKSQMDLILSVALQDNKPFVSLCKRISLIDFFNELIDSGQELDLIINDKYK